MKKIIAVMVYGILLCQNVAGATQIPPKELSDLVKEADHIIGGKIVKVDMIDEHGNLITDDKARTGPGLANTIRLHLKVDRKLILKTTKAVTPDIIIVNLWKRWHFTLGQIKEDQLNKDRIFLLKGDDYEEVYPMAFIRGISEKAEILKLLK